ncbi:rCG41850 [Rattus norvegicus]|uniref:RCG41850 n=1 Tax=Rattus norvegicus TaxID=10116 RepID=A6KKL2_RAT|nr:rCG41850 [Rattus norvegicus]
MNLKIPFIKTNTQFMWDKGVHITFRFPCFRGF